MALSQHGVKSDYYPKILKSNWNLHYIIEKMLKTGYSHKAQKIPKNSLFSPFPPVQQHLPSISLSPVMLLTTAWVPYSLCL